MWLANVIVHKHDTKKCLIHFRDANGAEDLHLGQKKGLEKQKLLMKMKTLRSLMALVSFDTSHQTQGGGGASKEKKIQR